MAMGLTQWRAAAVTGVCLIGIALCAGTGAAATVSWVCSTEAKPWQDMAAPVLAPAVADRPAALRVASEKTCQTIDGFGACFTELSWDALNKLPAEERRNAMEAFFGEQGCAFTMGRVPIGANDFSRDAYSLDDAPEDEALQHFSLARDEQALIPFIKAAMKVQPKLRCWGSPWSPPAWMKTNRRYSKGSLRWEPPVLRSYAQYLTRWVDAYRAQGINVFALMPQNEPNILSAYPSCGWTASQLREFIADYLGPTLRDRKTGVELWLGTLNGDPANGGNNPNDRLVSVLGDATASAFLTGATFQYDASNLIGSANALYPDKKLMESETECNSGKNSWADGQRLFSLMQYYFDRGANSYFLWNMVLDPGGMSTWKWKQNAPITADPQAGKLVFHAEFYVMKHFSHFIRAGAKRVLTTGLWGDQIAFRNADGSLVLVMGNSDRKALPVKIQVTGVGNADTLDITLPAQSINTILVAAR